MQKMLIFVLLLNTTWRQLHHWRAVIQILFGNQNFSHLRALIDVPNFIFREFYDKRNSDDNNIFLYPHITLFTFYTCIL